MHIIGPDDSQRQIKLQNNFSHPVTWNLRCRLGTANCYGSTTFSADAEETREVKIGNTFVLEGPYRSR